MLYTFLILFLFKQSDTKAPWKLGPDHYVAEFLAGNNEPPATVETEPFQRATPPSGVSSCFTAIGWFSVANLQSKLQSPRLAVREILEQLKGKMLFNILIKLITNND
jgi:hypothetical protein